MSDTTTSPTKAEQLAKAAAALDSATAATTSGDPVAADSHIRIAGVRIHLAEVAAFQ